MAKLNFAPRITFRVDASLEIGSGHLVRCLTLAGALRSRRAVCRFICRELPGNLIAMVRDQGFEVLTLSEVTQPLSGPLYGTTHAAWLGVPADTDARQTLDALDTGRVDWLVVDHYALDATWERQLKTRCNRLMVIDDLADRDHDADVLLDQNLGRLGSDYATRVPPNCLMLIGPDYALLRPEFSAARPGSLARRRTGGVKHLLLTMGGVDKDNMTGRVLEALRQVPLPSDVSFTVVMGAKAPWLDVVRAQAANMPWSCEVRVDVRTMAELMAASDLALGAAGSTAWERCCLGLPSLVWVLAENQLPGAAGLAAAGCALVMPSDETLPLALRRALLSLMRPDVRGAMQDACAAITDGDGTQRVMRHLLEA